MSIVNRRNAVIGWATWTTLKGLAARKARRAVPSGGDEESAGKKKTVKVIAVLVTAAGAVVFWKKRHRDATDYDSLASEEVGVGDDVPPPPE
jgi:hypothetical protein